MDEKIFAKGRLFELVQTTQDDGRVFEVARRAPGVRLIIVNREDKKVLLTKEFRSELQGWDYRLPGGKVFDTLDEFEIHRKAGEDILEAAVVRAKNEGAEEAGVDIKDLQLFKKSTLGATVEWDLYVFEVIDWRPTINGQQLEKGEQIEADSWFTFAEAEQMILEGKMQEERIALILLQWIRTRE